MVGHATAASVPFGGVHQSVVDQYNEAARIEMEKTRDFVVLHYHATQRDDTPFWRYCRDMPIPILAQRIEPSGRPAMHTRATANCSASIHGPRSCWDS